MIKTTIAALLLTTTAAVALDDKQIVDLSYTDNGSTYSQLDTADFDSGNARIVIDGRQGIVEYNASFDEEGNVDSTFGLAIPVKATGFGVVVGAEETDNAAIQDSVYYGGIYENDSLELRATYQDEADDYKVSGRYFLTDSWGLNAGVRFEDNIDSDSMYTVGVSYKF